jgi:tetratricopeptide (TPR) repeat protein
VSGVSGLDFPEDGRAFAIFDFDQDGDLDLVLKNRNSPQLRLLRNDSAGHNHSIAFRLQGTKSNRDAVGARLLLETSHRRYNKTVSSGSGFLSQSSRTVYFGLGPDPAILRLTVFWPGGGTQEFEGLPADQLIYLEEGRTDFKSFAFHHSAKPDVAERRADASEMTEIRRSFWLTEAVPSPPIELKSLDESYFSLERHRGQRLLLNFWATWCRPCQAELADLNTQRSAMEAQGVHPLLISVDEPSEHDAVRAFVKNKGLIPPVLLANEDVISQYSLLLRQLTDYATDLAIPASFLVDESGNIVKVYLGSTSSDQILRDVKVWPISRADLQRQALPFPGRSFVSDFRRNWTVFADSFALAGFTQSALRYLQYAVQIQPDNAEAFDHMGLVYANQGQWKEAFDSHSRSAELKSSPAVQAHLATALIHLGKLAEAELAASQALSETPQDPEALRVWAAVKSNRGKPEEALDALKRAIQLDPENASSLYNLGVIYEKMGQRTEAVTVLRQAIAVDPRHAESLAILGVMSAESGSLGDAASFFSQAIESRPGFAEAHRNLGLVYAQQGMWKEAERSFQASLNLRPDYAEALNDLGGVYLKTERYQEALPLFEQAQKANSEFVQAYLNEVRVYLAIGQKDKAISTLETLLQVHPKEPAATEWLRELKSGNH